MRRTALVVLLAVFSCLIGASAHAQPAADVSALRNFEAGKRLRIAGDLVNAAKAFQESLRYQPSIGALLNLGDCYKDLNDPGRAWQSYEKAAALAMKMNDPRYADALTSAKAIETRLPKVTLNVAPETSALEGLSIKVDDDLIAKDDWNRPITVMLGEHRIVAQAAGRKAWSTKVTALASAKLQVEVPALEPIGGSPSAPVAEKRSSGGSQKTIGLVAGGLGVAGLIVGSVTGLIASGQASDAKAACGNGGSFPSSCNPASKQMFDDAKTPATISTISFIAGGVLAAGGAVLYFTAPSTTSAASTGSRVGVSPVVGPAGAGLSVAGAF